MRLLKRSLRGVGERLGVLDRERDTERGDTERRGEREWAGDAERVRDLPRSGLRWPDGEPEGIGTVEVEGDLGWAVGEGGR